MVVHEFISNRLDPRRLAFNDSHWRTFVDAIGKGLNFPSQRDCAIGPVRVAGGEHVPSDVPLYLGKIETRLP
jgi:hypothetical protein